MIPDFYSQREKYLEYHQQAKKQRLLAQIRTQNLESSKSLTPKWITWRQNCCSMILGIRNMSGKQQQVFNKRKMRK
jgi:hypothetical protein